MKLEIEIESIIARIRRDARISQTRLAREIGREPRTIKRWEKGEAEPSFSMVCKIVKRFELNILRYTFSQDDLIEIIRRGFAEYAYKLRDGLYIPHKILVALNDRDWEQLRKIRTFKLAETIASEIWEQIEDHKKWAKGIPSIEAAESAYQHYVLENQEDIEESAVIDALRKKFHDLNWMVQTIGE